MTTHWIKYVDSRNYQIRLFGLIFLKVEYLGESPNLLYYVYFRNYVTEDFYNENNIKNIIYTFYKNNTTFILSFIEKSFTGL